MYVGVVLILKWWISIITLILLGMYGLYNNVCIDKLIIVMYVCNMYMYVRYNQGHG